MLINNLIKSGTVHLRKEYVGSFLDNRSHKANCTIASTHTDDLVAVFTHALHTQFEVAVGSDAEQRDLAVCAHKLLGRSGHAVIDPNKKLLPVTGKQGGG